MAARTKKPKATSYTPGNYVVKWLSPAGTEEAREFSSREAAERFADEDTRSTVWYVRDVMGIPALQFLY